MPVSEIRTTLLLAALFAFRMLGLFMILPVFSLYSSNYEHTTPILMGMALGIYGLTQALCQLPFGFLSDRLGRKPLLYFGLLLLALGSFIAGIGHHIYTVILGRALQGAGAIGSTILACASDLTSEQHRTKAMAIIGITIGATFSLSMIIGPFIAAHYHLSGIFFLSLFFAIAGLFITFLLPHTNHTKLSQPVSFKQLFTLPLLFLNTSIFLLHALLTANFIAIPLVLLHQLSIPKSSQWSIYVPVLIISALFMSPLLRKSETDVQRIKLFHHALIFLFLSQLGLTLFNASFALLFFSLIIFFTAFNLLEALLPTLITQTAPAEIRGTALGAYSTCQFLGIFFGGTLGGFIYGQFSTMGVFLMGLCITLSWLYLSYAMTKDKYEATLFKHSQ